MYTLSSPDLPPTAALAFLGDAVHTLYVRRRVLPGTPPLSGELHTAAQDYVTAEAQAAQAARVRPLFTPEEEDIFRRAYNSKHLNRPKHASAADYRAATGWEAVLGALHLAGMDDRAGELLARAFAADEMPPAAPEK